MTNHLDYLQIDNFFEEPDIILNLMNRLDWFEFNQHPSYPEACGKYVGKRTRQLHEIEPDFFNSVANLICKKVYSLDSISNISGFEYICSMYFSHLMKNDEPEKNSELKVIHKDEEVHKAGLIYLSKDIDSDSGTSFYDDDMKKIKEAKNKFNRLVSYSGDNFHGTSKYVDDRFCLLFFFKTLKVYVSN